jgi:hypothetical protein
MTLPSVTVEIAFGNPTSSPTWVDVTAYALEISIRRGRQHELERVQAGTATLTLDNRDRRFDPTFAAGPYYGNLLPMRRVRVSLMLNSQAYRLFTGYVESWPLEWPGPIEATVAIQATDGFDVLSAAKIVGDYPEESTGARINRILDACGWSTGGIFKLDSSLLDSVTELLGPSGDRIIATGQSTMQAQTFDKVTALQALQEAEQVEYGLLFVDGDGAVRFVDRHSLLYNRTPRAVFGDGTASGELPYVDMKPVLDRDLIYNDVRMTRYEGTEHAVSDATSQDRYFVRTLEHSSLPLTHADGPTQAENEVQARAEFLLSQYKEPAIRVAEIEIDGIGAADNSIWAAVLPREIGDVVTVRRRQAGGALMEITGQIAQVSWDLKRGEYRLRWRLGMVDTRKYLLLSDAGFTLDDALLAY